MKDPIQIDDKNGCWIWHGPHDPYGFPIASGGYFGNEIVNEDGVATPGRVYRLQRVIFFKTHGYTPSRISTSCRHRSCLNPEHLQDKNKLKAEQVRQANLARGEQRLKELALLIDSLKESNDPIAIEYREECEKEVEQIRKGEK